MRFKDKLKELRRTRGLTQKELGEKVFVSRSAIAKWENGLGLPSPASYEALLSFFEVSEKDLPLNATEEEPKIRKRVIIHFVLSALSWCLILALAISPFALLYAVNNGYGFTSKMAAGKYFADNEVISTSDYDFYISYFRDTDEAGNTVELGISSFCVVEKHFYGYKRIERDAVDFRKPIFCEGASEGERYGLLYSFKGEDCYYHIFRSTITLLGPIESNENNASVPVDQNIISKLYIDGEEIDLRYGSFFITEEKVTEFEVIEYSGEQHRLTVRG